MRGCCALATLIAAACFLQIAASAQSAGDVTIRVIDENGRTIDCGVATFVNVDSREDFRSHFEGLRGTHIPYGTYLYSLWRRPPSDPGAVIEGRVEVRMAETLSIVKAQRLVLSRAQFAFDGRAPRDFVIRGRLEPMPAMPPTMPGWGEELTWIRLSPLMGDGPNLDVEVEASGEFCLHRPLWGSYLLTVNRGTRIVCVQPVEFQQGLRAPKPFVVSLSCPHVETMYVQ